MSFYLLILILAISAHGRIMNSNLKSSASSRCTKNFDLYLHILGQDYVRLKQFAARRETSEASLTKAAFSENRKKLGFDFFRILRRVKKTFVFCRCTSFERKLNTNEKQFRNACKVFLRSALLILIRPMRDLIHRLDIDNNINYLPLNAIFLSPSARSKRMAGGDRRLVYMYCRTNFILEIKDNGKVVGNRQKTSKGQ